MRAGTARELIHRMQVDLGVTDNLIAEVQALIDPMDNDEQLSRALEVKLDRAARDTWDLRRQMEDRT